jgi:hypothetical protein
VKAKAATAADIVIPRRTVGSGKTISAKVKLDELGGGDPSKWGYQVVMQSNEGFPDKSDLLSRKVNEFEGQHRFGGGNDGDCDPHVMDILAGKGAGTPDEAQAQYDMLKHECGADGSSVKRRRCRSSASNAQWPGSTGDDHEPSQRDIDGGRRRGSWTGA